MCRQTDPYEESPSSSECSTRLTLPSRATGEKTELCLADLCANQETGPESQIDQLGDSHCLAEGNRKCCNANMKEGILIFTRKKGYMPLFHPILS